jgi:hypothetical protein
MFAKGPTACTITITKSEAPVLPVYQSTSGEAIDKALAAFNPLFSPVRAAC